MKKMIPVFALLTLVPGAVHAQAASASSMEAARNIWRVAHEYVAKSAEQMPAEKYSYKPIATVRSFADMLGHIAGSEFMFCAAVLGEPSRPENAIEKLKKDKDGLIASLKESAAYCERAYAQSDAVGAKKMKMFGDESSVLEVLILNGAHDYEHYGNLVTYLRMNGMVPPSSQPSR